MCANGFNPYFPQVKKTIIVYSLAIAGAAFILQWMEFLYVVRVFSTEIYMVLIAVFFPPSGSGPEIVCPGVKSLRILRKTFKR